MSSLLKSETARENGAKSHGPVTPEGKARSSANSRRHGLASASILMDGESAEDFQLLRADFLNQFQPQTAVETDLVDVMAIARWRLRRLLAIEAHLFDQEILCRKDEIKYRSKTKAMEQEDRLAFVFQSLGDHGNSLTLLLRYEGSLNRSYDKALKQLLQLQSARPEPPLGSFRIFENAEPPATIDTSLEDEAPAPPATSVPRLQLPPVVDTLSELSRDFNTLPVGARLATARSKDKEKSCQL
jgi:hypothetical protein